MKFDVLNRFSGAVQFTAEIDCDSDTAIAIKLGLAAKWALKTGASLDGARLDRANLDRANLDRARLDGASLVGASLAGANLAGASLVGASLAGASLVGASLAGANLAGASLAGASGVIDGGTPNGWRCVGWLRDGWLSVRVGCHDKRIDDGREYWTGRDDRREVLAALDYVEAVAKLRGWTLAPVDKGDGR